MAFSDKSPQCSGCGATFFFSAGEQRFFAQKGGQVSQNGRCSRRYTTECGKTTEMPFKLLEDGPLYCRGGSNQIRLRSQYLNGLLLYDVRSTNTGR